MGRVNVFVRAGNKNRDVSVGGRGGASDSGYAVLNTDNATQHDCALSVRAEVLGQRGGTVRKTCDCGYKFTSDKTPRCPECHAPRQGMDTRASHFEVELPDQQDENCTVEIVEHGHRLACLARLGAALCVLKGASEAAVGQEVGDADKVKSGTLTIKKAVEIVDELDAEIGKNLPKVMLPGGVTLAHALACVEVCRRMAEGRRSKN